jgi:hypothetical protein
MITQIPDSFKEPESSTMFLNNLTVVDHAYIDNEGCVKGGSFNPSFIVSGRPDPTEKVVVDFSTIKKDIKTAIDKHEFDIHKNGFDHKLWIIEGYSNVVSIDDSSDDVVTIVTPNMTLILAKDAVRVIEQKMNTNSEYSVYYIGDAFRRHVQTYLQTKYPDINVKVQCFNNVDKHLIDIMVATATFHYVHGLKDSTSFGCQNIAHGHRSFIHTDNVSYNSLVYDELCEIAKELDNTVFVRKDNVLSITPNEIVIGYSTEQRGRFKMTLNTDYHKVVVLPTETTVEFLAAYIKQYYSTKLKVLGAREIYVSEGLSKGAVEHL